MEWMAATANARTFLCTLQERWLPWVSWHSSRKYNFLPSFNKEVYKEAVVIEGQEVMTFRREEQ